MNNSLLKWKSLATKLSSSARYVSVATPSVVAVALLSSWFAFHQVQQVLDDTSKTVAARNDIAATQAATVKKMPLTAAGYEEARRLVGEGNPGVVVSLNKDKSALTVSVTDPALMPEWLYLISTMQAYQPGLMWQAETICLKKCEGGEAAFAELKAYTQQVVIQ
jgi:hypothetical protein